MTAMWHGHLEASYRTACMHKRSSKSIQMEVLVWTWVKGQSHYATSCLLVVFCLVWCISVPAYSSTPLAGVTQSPWLHQFHLGWTTVHPSYWTSRNQKGWVKKAFCSPSNSQFSFHLPLPLLTQLPHLPTYPTHFPMAKPISLLD